MKVVILAGGFGTRLSEYTDTIPKPMVTIGDKPILWHIMSCYAKYGFKEFIVALGYKSSVVKEFFVNYNTFCSDLTVNLSDNSLLIHQYDDVDWKVSLIDTGYHSMTGGRLKRLEPLLDNSTFMLTYGDGVSDIDIHKLFDFHRSHGKHVTVTAVRPSARFGELKITDNQITSFSEKPQIDQGWINGGFFVMEPEFLKCISDDSTILEREPLEYMASVNQLMAFKHDGFWQCMDSKRDRDYLNSIASSSSIPWLS